ncbi:MAG: hypothetical protein RJB65_1652 [Actinomycetota bacterium]
MAFVLALASAFVYGTGDWFGGHAARRRPSIGVAAIGQSMSLVLVALAVLLGSASVPDAGTWGWSAAGGVLGALGIAGLYHGFAIGDVSVVAPVSAVVGAVLPVVAGLVLGDRPGALALGGIVLAVAAIALVSGALGRSSTVEWRIVALAAAVGACFGSLFVCLERADGDSGMWPLLVMRLVSVPMLLLLLPRRRSGERGGDSRSLVLSLVAGTFDMAANVLYLLAVREGMLSLVAVIASLYPAATVALAAGVDGERVSRPQLIGLMVAAAALVMVTLSRS